MRNNNFLTSLNRTFRKIGLQTKKHSPEILVVAGVVGTIASTVMACQATTKLSGILDKAKNDIDTIHNCVENPDLLPEGSVYTVEDSKKDLTIVYAKTGVELVKLYAPSVILGALSITAIASSHNILRKRNMAIAAAYATIDKGFKDYRGRVVDRFGKEIDRELRYNIKAKEIEERIVDEDGNEKTEKKVMNVISSDGPSDFSRFFDESCAGWSKNPEHNMTFLKMQQAWANRKLQEDGYLFLNDVYKMLGMNVTKEGQAVGWVYDPNNQVGDNYVDFGIYDQYGIEKFDSRKRAFVNGDERNILLDFNVDGVIWDLIN